MTVRSSSGALVIVLAGLSGCGVAQTPASQPPRPAPLMTSTGARTGQDRSPPGSNLQDMHDLYALKLQITRRGT